MEGLFWFLNLLLRLHGLSVVSMPYLFISAFISIVSVGYIIFGVCIISTSSERKAAKDRCTMRNGLGI